MNVNESISIACQVEDIAAKLMYRNVPVDDIYELLMDMGARFRQHADRLDKIMYDQYLNDQADAYERYDDAIVVGG